MGGLAFEYVYIVVLYMLRACLFTILQITNITPGITKLLHDLNPYKSAGPYFIPVYMLKVAAEEVSSILFMSFQVSLDSRNVHSNEKHTNSRKVTNIKPFITVSLSSVSCKILEPTAVS